MEDAPCKLLGAVLRAEGRLDPATGVQIVYGPPPPPPPIKQAGLRKADELVLICYCTPHVYYGTRRRRRWGRILLHPLGGVRSQNAHVRRKKWASMCDKYFDHPNPNPPPPPTGHTPTSAKQDSIPRRCGSSCSRRCGPRACTCSISHVQCIKGVYTRTRRLRRPPCHRQRLSNRSDRHGGCLYREAGKWGDFVKYCWMMVRR